MANSRLVLVSALLLVAIGAVAYAILGATHSDEQGQVSAPSTVAEDTRGIQITWDNVAGGSRFTSEDKAEIITALRAQLAATNPRSARGFTYRITAATRRATWGSIAVAPVLKADPTTGAGPFEAVLLKDAGSWRVFVPASPRYCEVLKESQPDLTDATLRYMGCPD